jgi:hypothetical protein
MTMVDSPSDRPLSPASTSGAPKPATEAAPAGVTVAELQNRIEIAQAVEGVEPKQKPFAWPILLALMVPAAVGVTLALLWQEDNLRGLRVGWIVLWSVLPGFAIMATLGSIAQMRRRPILSLLSFVIGCGTIAFCWWAIKTVTALNLLQ